MMLTTFRFTNGSNFALSAPLFFQTTKFFPLFVFPLPCGLLLPELTLELRQTHSFFLEFPTLLFHFLPFEQVLPFEFSKTFLLRSSFPLLLLMMKLVSPVQPIEIVLLGVGWPAPGVNELEMSHLLNTVLHGMS